MGVCVCSGCWVLTLTYRHTKEATPTTATQVGTYLSIITFFQLSDGKADLDLSSCVVRSSG